ncbi:MAG: proprotein convertase P-domain-containing protein, partial [Chitinophagales bacterium]
MKKILLTLIIICSVGIAFAQNVGIGTATPSQKLDVDGWIQVGDETTGTTGEAGTVRYNDTDDVMEWHDGTTWHRFSSDVTSPTEDETATNLPDATVPVTPPACTNPPASVGSSNPGADINDANDPTDVIAVAGLTGVVCEVEVEVNITHTWMSDLSLSLTSPDGTIIDLSSGNGGNNAGTAAYIDTRFDDDAGTAVTAGGAPFTGTFRPEVALSSFDGETANGNWTLSIVDGAGGDDGTFNSWELFVSASAPATPTWTKVGEASIEYKNGTAIIVQSTYSADAASSDGIVTALTRGTAAAAATSPGATPPGTVLGYASDSPNDGASNTWISTSINNRDV